MLFPTSITNSLIAVGTDGLQERDRMVRAAIAIVCELGECLAFVSGPSGSCYVRGQKNLVNYLICEREEYKTTSFFDFLFADYLHMQP